MRRWKVLGLVLCVLASAALLGRNTGAAADPHLIISEAAGLCQTFSLTPDIQTDSIMEKNTRSLQAAIDYAAEYGGGSVTLPAGHYYFAPLTNNFTDNPYTAANDQEWHIISCKSHVKLLGADGADGPEQTVLYPVGEKDKPIDMFYFAKLLDSGEAAYLSGAEFENFSVDCRYAVNRGKYTAKGKGFYFVLLSDCHWRQVHVRNSDGSGFGVDCPIRCSMTDCEAVQCGKQEAKAGIGASGFGIGYGYSAEESMVLEHCSAFNNRRFGFFLENQRRFRPDLYREESKVGFLVKNCISGGNLYNYGAEYCKNLTYEDCRVQKVAQGELFTGKTSADYYFPTSCLNCRVISNSIAPGGADYSEIYNFEEYISRYPDIRRAYGKDPQKALGHFLSYGMKEGRIGRADFVWNYYRHNYPDLQRAFGNDARAYYLHYLKYGIREGRFGDRILPRADGIDYSPVYEEAYYKAGYSDLRKAFGEDSLKVFQHFLKYGMKEGRQAKESFRVEVYRASYPDLQRAFGGNLKDYYLHYLRHGVYEKRTHTY